MNSSTEIIDSLKDLQTRTLEKFHDENIEIRRVRNARKGETSRTINKDPSIIAHASQVTGFLLGLSTAIELIEKGEVKSPFYDEFNS